MCWYKHDQTVNEGGIDTAKIKCNKCDTEFENKPEFMRHKKQEHRQSVPACVNETHGTCVFGEEKCWFRHNNKDENNQTYNKDKVNENKEVMERIFNMMEKMTNRIMKIEELQLFVRCGLRGLSQNSVSTINSFFLSLFCWVTFLPEGIIVGFRNFAWDFS